MKINTHFLKYLLISFALIFSGLANKLAAQKNDIQFDRISLLDGLSQSTVYSIWQDNAGFMWFGTLDGLNKFDGYNITVYRNSHTDLSSISDNSITVIFEDSRKNLWIGTRSEGLCLYNRKKDNFTVFKSDTKNQNSLVNNKVTSIIEDVFGNLWIGTEGGVSQMIFDDKGKFTFKSYSTQTKKNGTLPLDEITTVESDHYGNIFFGTKQGIIFLQSSEIGKEVMKFALINSPAENGFWKNNFITSIETAKNNIIWIGTRNGLHFASLDDFISKPAATVQFTSFYHTLGSTISISDNYINIIKQEKNGDVWIGTKFGGLNLITLKEIEAQTFHFSNHRNDPTNPYSLSIDNIISIYQDNANTLWFGTSLGGISKWNKAVAGFTLYRHKPFDSNSINNSQVRTIYQDKDGIFWIGTVDGGLNRWDSKTNSFTYYVHNEDNANSLSDNHVRCILEDSKGRFWIGTDGGGLNLFDRKKGSFKHFKYQADKPNSLSNNSIWKIYEDRKGQLWIATFGGGLNKFEPETESFTAFKTEPNSKTNISDNLVTTILEDKKNRLWVGTYGGGLNLMNRDNNTFEAFKYAEKDSFSIGNNRIYSIFEDIDGVIWIGTKGNLDRYDELRRRFIRFNEKNGFPNNVMMGILEDKDGNLWISTNGGLTKFNKKTFTTRNYDIRDGLQSNEFLVGSFFKAKDGMMLFGGINGFNTFYPDNIVDNPFVPPIVLTRFQIFNKDTEQDTAITEKRQFKLTYDQNVFSFDFVALNYIFPEKNQYSYLMEGFDKQWNRVKNRRFASYTNLPPGEYTFRIRGSNNDGVWNEEGLAISIIISPPFWKTIWFYALVFLFIMLSIYGYIKIRERQLIHDNKRLEKLVVERTAEIQHQKQEIEQQRDTAIQQNETITNQKKEIEKQRDIADEQRRNLTENIQYASHIQEAILPPQEFFSKVFPEHFVLYKPKDIVSGDYYWLAQKNNKIFFAVADCTGHGVSGAFMSMLGVSFLNAIMYKHIDENNEIPITASQILDELRENIKQSLHKTGKENEAQGRVGMDIALCVFNIDTKMMQYAGAYNPLYIVRKPEDPTAELEFTQYKADKMPIGFFFKEKPFTNYEFQVYTGDSIYIFSDGYIDQFGGDKKRRLQAKDFKNILIEITNFNMKTQKTILNQNFEEWKGEYEQVDDVLVMGLKIP